MINCSTIDGKSLREVEVTGNYIYAVLTGISVLETIVGLGIVYIGKR